VLKVCKRIPGLYMSFFETLKPSAALSFTPWMVSDFHTVEPGQAVLIPCVLGAEKDAEEKGG